MKSWIAFSSIFIKDMRTYYLKPPNVSWGIIFPLAWTGMFFIRSGLGVESVLELLPGVMTISILFGTTSLLSVTLTFERRNRSFDRLLLSPISLELLMLAKTSGAILFGIVNAFVPIVIAAFLTDMSGIAWSLVIPAIILIGVVSTFLGLFISVSASEVFEAQTFSNFFRFPMMFLCGLFFPILSLPIFIRWLSFILPVTYGVDILQGAINGEHIMSFTLDFIIIGVFCIVLFLLSLRNVKRKWIA
jgi:ABC-2 type transport system permease protein